MHARSNRNTQQEIPRPRIRDKETFGDACKDELEPDKPSPYK
jgi:hypothetical protein